MAVEFGFAEIGLSIAAIGALGTAAFGLVDATKAFRGGISNMGLGLIRDVLKPFEAALRIVDGEDPFFFATANWLNGMDKGEQKTLIKNHIRLGLTTRTAHDLAAAVGNIDGELLARVAAKMEAGEEPTPAELTMLGRFEAVVDARLGAAFERAEQVYRNTAKVAAAAVAIILALAAAPAVMETADYGLALLIGLIATPLAPVAKDVSSALSTAVAAFKSVKR